MMKCEQKTRTQAQNGIVQPQRVHLRRLIHAPRTPHALGSTPGYEHDLTRRPSLYSHLATPFNAPVKACGFFMPPVNTLFIRLPFLRTIVLDSEIDGVRLPGPGASLGEPLMNVRERLRSKCRCEQFSRSHQEEELRCPCSASCPTRPALRLSASSFHRWRWHPVDRLDEGLHGSGRSSVSSARRSQPFRASPLQHAMADAGLLRRGARRCSGSLSR